MLSTMFGLLAVLFGLLGAALRSRRDLVLENLLPRHQLATLARPTRKRPPLRRRDKLVWVLARRLCPDWRRHLVLVRPEAVVAWHRRGWRLFRWWRSRCPLGRPPLSAEVRAELSTITQLALAQFVGRMTRGRRARSGGPARQAARMRARRSGSVARP